MNYIYDSWGSLSQWGDDSDKVSEVWHVGQDVGETNDELSEIDDNEISEADMMSDKSHEAEEWWWAGWDLRFVRLKTHRGWWLTNYDCDFEYNLICGNIF